MGSAKFNIKRMRNFYTHTHKIRIACIAIVQERIFKEFYSYTFPSEYMGFQAFVEAMDNKLSTIEKSKIHAYFRAFDSQQKSYLTYSDYLLGVSIYFINQHKHFSFHLSGLAAMDPSTSHGGKTYDSLRH